jgi:hypothetical protein
LWSEGTKTLTWAVTAAGFVGDANTFKQIVVVLFEPNAPAPKRSAVKNIGMGGSVAF